MSLSIVIPAAGNGQRFKDAGYTDQKYMIPVVGKPMIERVITSIRPKCKYDLDIVTQETLGFTTKGAVETALYGRMGKQPLLIANCDQLVDLDINKFIETDLDANLAVFKSQSPYHSYVEVKDGLVTRIKEKVVISNNAVTGIYYFKSGYIFKKYALQVIENASKTNGEYYISSVLEAMLRDGLNIGVQDCQTAVLGTPEDLQRFEVAVKIWSRL